MIKEKKMMILGEILLIGSILLPLIYMIVFFKEIGLYIQEGIVPNSSLGFIAIIISIISIVLVSISIAILTHNLHEMAFKKALE